MMHSARKFYGFKKINALQGGVLTTVGILGTFLSGFTIYCLIFHVKLPYSQVLIYVDSHSSNRISSDS